MVYIILSILENREIIGHDLLIIFTMCTYYLLRDAYIDIGFCKFFES